jgi:hypothetical protein
MNATALARFFASAESAVVWPQRSPFALRSGMVGLTMIELQSPYDIKHPA